MSHLAAFQDADGEGGTANATAAEENQETPDLKGRIEVTADEAPAGVEVTVAGEVTVTRDSHAAAANESESGMMSAEGSGGMGFASSATAKPRRPLKGAAAEFSRRSAREVDERLNQIIQGTPVENLTFPGENPLTDILEQISHHATVTYCVDGQRFTILPDLKALNEDAVVLDQVMIKDIELDGIALSSALDLILRQTDPPLTWVVKDEVVLITTVSAAESDEYMFLRSYDITRLREISQLSVVVWTEGGQRTVSGGGGGMFSLFAEPVQFGGGGSGAVPQKTMTEPAKKDAKKSSTKDEKQEVTITWEAGLMQTVQDLSSPPAIWFDIDGEGGKISVAGNRLIVRQSRKGHEQVVDVLEQLEMAAEDIAAEVAQ